MKATNSTKRRPELTESLEDLSLKRIRAKLQDEAANTRDEFFSQLMGMSKDHANDHEGRSVKSKEKQLSTGEIIIFQLFSAKAAEKENKPAKAETRAAAAIDYHADIARSGERLSRSETTEHQRQIKQIMTEIKKLVSSTKSLQMEFGHVVVETAPANPGKYYTNFFEWLLIMLEQARRKVENSKSWLEAVNGKNSKKQGYWGKAKSMGTSFTQNNERAVATSTG